MAATGAPDRTVLRTDHQTAGKGRLGRQWEAPPGENLLVSILFRDLPTDIHVLTQMVCLAAARVAHSVGVPAVLKWPNDLLVDNKKLAGLLAQAGGHGQRGEPEYVVAGIGVNVGWAPPDAASLRGSGWSRDITPAQFLEEMLAHLNDLLDLDDEQRHNAYVSSLGTIGQRVQVDLPTGEQILGHAIGVERDGRLIVLDECAISHRIDTADVVHLRSATE
jgi:BirA family transcriptional regulator, biotin operon repressor / biotin---[acetyl-CoA-carboxylase] ligase